MKEELDFKSFKVTKKRVIIELPTSGMGGLIYIDPETNALDSGWYKVVAVGTEVTDCKAGDEVFVYFPNKPFTFDEIVFKSRKEQVEQIKSEKFAESIKVNLGSSKDNILKTAPIERKFAEIGEYDVKLVRDWKEEIINKITKEELEEIETRSKNIIKDTTTGIQEISLDPKTGKPVFKKIK